MNKIVIDGKRIQKVRDVSIEELYSTYKGACKAAIDYWQEQAIVYQDEWDFRPLEVLFLCERW